MFPAVSPTNKVPLGPTHTEFRFFPGCAQALTPLVDIVPGVVYEKVTIPVESATVRPYGVIVSIASSETGAAAGKYAYPSKLLSLVAGATAHGDICGRTEYVPRP